MESCSMDCHKTTQVVVDEQISSAAERLALLLIDQPVFRDFAILSYEVRRDPEVNAILLAMNERVNSVDPSAETGALEAQLEELPVVIEFRKAEAAVRELFRAVDDLISEAAGGIAFAENARPAACA